VIFGTPSEPAFGTGVSNSFANGLSEQGKRPDEDPVDLRRGEERKGL
jgi:hypothetical protein